MIETKDVFELLKGYYPTASTLTTTITSEIANGLNDAELNYDDFVKVVAKFRAHDQKASWAPNLRQLQVYFPASRASVRVRPDCEKRWLLWPARLYHAPQRDTFVRLWHKGRCIEAIELLLSMPGLTQEDAYNAESNLQWAQHFHDWGQRLAAARAKKYPKSVRQAQNLRDRFHQVFQSYATTEQVE